jgi:hypothetical protein
MKQLIFLAACGYAAAASAHDGHGLDGTHWHATDVAGFAWLAAVVALGVWWIRRK